MGAAARAGALAAAISSLAIASVATPARAQTRDACPAAGCVVEGGYYRIALPPGETKPVGAILFFHGYQGSAEETLASDALAAVAARLGVALIAPHGEGRTWSYPGSPARNRDEFAFVGHVLDDATRRFAIDGDRLLASGFSQGASMVWYLACRMPARFRAFAPVAGAFWEPLPESCDGPRPAMVHVHGTSDPTVPMAGRRLRGGFKQGDVLQSMAVLAPACVAAWSGDEAAGDGLACRRATGCETGPRLELCLHAGGHDFDARWLVRIWAATMTP
jgi:polyhydroxybutyrate depolymerase